MTTSAEGGLRDLRYLFAPGGWQVDVEARVSTGDCVLFLSRERGDAQVSVRLTISTRMLHSSRGPSGVIGLLVSEFERALSPWGESVLHKAIEGSCVAAPKPIHPYLQVFE